jgi:short-subunit dehydrogenase
MSASPLTDKVIVITGASSGIGAELAKKLAKHNVKLVLLARRKDALEAVADQCQASGAADTLIVPCDVTERKQIEDALTVTVEKFGTVDVWINNAGRGITKSVLELTDEDVNEMMKVNVLSALYGMQVAVKYFQTRTPASGMVMNVSSQLGRISSFAPMRSAYCASKYSLNALTSALRVDIAKSYPEIIISLFSPGAVATDFGSNALHGGVDSRKNPGAQDVGEVADVIIEGIIEKKEDFYSRSVYQTFVSEYYKDVASADRKFIEGGAPEFIKSATSKLDK